MRADDLVPLLGSGDEGAEGTRYAQGTVVAWDKANGRNRISVAGTELQDLPILNTGEAIALKVGHVVGLLRWKSQWFIIGRITIPGSGQFASASVSFDSRSGKVTGFAAPGGSTWTTVLAVPRIPVPAWASKVQMTLTGLVSLNNTSSGLSNLCYRSQMNIFGAETVNGEVMFTATPATYWRSGAVADTYVADVTGITEIGGGIQMQNMGWPANVDNTATIALSAVFRSEV